MIEDFWILRINVKSELIFSLFATINCVIFYWFLKERVYPFKELYIVKEYFNKKQVAKSHSSMQ